jgi:putative transposase
MQVFCRRRNKNKINAYKNMRARLQFEGILSAKGTIEHLAGKENSLMTDVNHCISKEILKFAVENGISVIGLEDLIGIRDRTNNNSLNMKAKSSGSITECLNPVHTSRTWYRCEDVSKNSIDGLKFLCKACSFEPNADFNCARNIEHRT